MNLDVGTVIREGLSRMTTQFMAYLIGLGVISALTMAVLQAIKEMTPLRKNYNRRRMRSWLQARAGAGASGLALQAERELLRLATDADESAFYGADLGALCTQFGNAAQLVVDYPERSKELFVLLTRNAEDTDVTLLLKAQLPHPVPFSVVETLAPDEMRAIAENRQQVIDARNRIRHQITQSIASFQMSSGARWQQSLKWASWVVSSLLVVLAEVIAAPDVQGNNLIRSKVLMVTTAALGGFLAPIARDLVAALQGLRD